MKQRYLKNTKYTIFFITIDVLMTIGLILLAIYFIQQNSQYGFDFNQAVIFSIIFFFVVFNAHFVYIGVFSRVIMDENYLIIKKAIKIDAKVKWHNIRDIRKANEVRQIVKIIDVPIIIIDAYDEMTKSDICLSVDYTKKIYDALIEGVNNADSKTIEKMEKYFD